MDWSLIGHKIPRPVFRSHLLRMEVDEDPTVPIRWVPMSPNGPEWGLFDANILSETERVLLMIHGTGQRTREGFLGFDNTELVALYHRYGGRVLAWEHRALGHAVERNVRELCHAVDTAGVHLNLDVLALSRGGLIARYVSEGWSRIFRGGHRLDIDKLVFVGTPNGGTPSARKDPRGRGALWMKRWREDVRRVAMTGSKSREVVVHDDPWGLPRYDGTMRRHGGWFFLPGSMDQLPGAEPLRRLNGFMGSAPSRPQREPRYYAIASVFDFQHGAPDDIVLPGPPAVRRSEVAQFAIPVPNDLVVPTASVYSPLQGPDSSGLFPLSNERLLVLGAATNATHVGLLHVNAVRHRILSWLGVSALQLGGR